MMLAMFALEREQKECRWGNTRKVTMEHVTPVGEILDSAKQTGPTFSYESSDLEKKLQKTSFQQESEALPDCLWSVYSLISQADYFRIDRKRGDPEA